MQSRMVRDRGSTEILKFTKRGMGEEGRRPSCIALIGLRVRVYVYVYVRVSGITRRTPKRNPHHNNL